MLSPKRSLYYLLLSLLFFGTLQAQEFNKDFGSNGRLAFDASSPYMPPSAATLTTDGKILIAGSISDQTGSRKFRTYIARLQANGQLDETFGDKGYAYPVAGFDHETIPKIIEMPNGIIMVCIAYQTISTRGVVFLRFSKEGNADKTYGQNGWAAHPGYFGDFDVYPDGSLLSIPLEIGSAPHQLYKFDPSGKQLFNYKSNISTAGQPRAKLLRILPEGGYLVGGLFSERHNDNYNDAFLVRLSDQGLADKTFGANGMAIIKLSTKEALSRMSMQLKGDAGIAISFNSRDSLFLAQVDNAGKIPPLVNNGATKQFRTSTGQFIPVDARLDPQGNALVPGIVEDKNRTYQFSARRFLADGNIDNNFGPLGYAAVDDHPLIREASLAMALPDNGMLIMGSEFGPNISRVAIGRIDAQGNKDRSFGTDGTASISPITGPNRSEEVLQDIIRSKDGKIISAGFMKSATAGGTTKNSIIITKVDTSGKPDPSFGQNGTVLLNVGSLFYGWSYNFYRGMVYLNLNLAENSDGSLLVLAPSWDYLANRRTVSLYKLSSSGKLDTNFGSNGRTPVPISWSYDLGKQQGNGLVIQPDGKIVVGLSADVQYMLRFDSSGKLDPTFGKNGIVTESLLPFYAYSDGEFNMSKKLAMYPDGKLVLIGKTNNFFSGNFTTFKYNADGSPDLGFNQTGRVSVEMFPKNINDWAQAVLIQPDSKILVAGMADGRPCLLRLTSEGKADSDFGPSGKRTNLARLTEINGLALQSDGKILMIGGSATTGPPLQSSIHMIRTYPDGQQDMGFGTEGRFSLPPVIAGRHQDIPGGLLATNTGRIYICGGTDIEWNSYNTEPKSLIVGLSYQTDDYKPKISSFLPKAATTQSTVTITGSNFLYVQSVSFGGVPARSFRVVAPDRIEAELSTGASGKITVRTRQGVAETEGFSYIEKPTLNHTGESYILKGETLPLRTVPQSGLAYQWYRNGIAIPGATTFSYDAVESGQYKVSASIANVEVFSDLLQLHAKFWLPADNFTLSSKSVSCIGQRNGEISITAKQELKYNIRVKGQNYDREFKMTTAASITGLVAGSYSVCIIPENTSNFQQCFDMTIKEPERLSVFSSIDRDNGTVTLEMSGAETYYVSLNNKNYQTASKSITLPLATGKNDLSVSTGLQCQGSFARTIEHRGNVVYPNPFSDHLNIVPQRSWGEKLTLQITDARGSRVHLSAHTTSGGEIRIQHLEKLPSGVYILTIKSNSINQTFKLLKP